MTNFLGGSHYVYNWVYGLRRSPTWKHCPFGSIRYLPSYSAITWNDSWNFGLHFQRLDQRTSHQRLSGIYRTLQRWSWSTKSHRLDSRRMGKLLYLHLENVRSQSFLLFAYFYTATMLRNWRSTRLGQERILQLLICFRRKSRGMRSPFQLL